MSERSKTGRAAESVDLQVRQALRGLRTPLVGVSGISCLGNVLMLTGPLFMMLVYNKVLTSKSVPTLVALCLLALLLYSFYGFLEGLRGKLMARVGIAFDHKLAPSLFLTTLQLPLHFGPHARQHDPLQDLATIRNFVMGGGPSALLDLPWIPLYFAILYIVHPHARRHGHFRRGAARRAQRRKPDARSRRPHATRTSRRDRR